MTTGSRRASGAATNPDEARLLELAAQVADGTPVEWASVDQAAEAGAERNVIRQLQSLARVCRAHREMVAPPAHWGHLVLRERIGRGASAEVFRAWDPTLEREVALKLFDPGRPGRALEEARRLARLRHRAVVHVYGVDRLGDQDGLSMELISGQTLASVVQDRGPLAPDEVVRIGIELCRALTAVHQAGLIHRDVKASNVMCETDGRVVLMDMGLAAAPADLAPGDARGTPLYMAPEVLTGEAASARSDVYSLGVLLFHLLTGAYPGMVEPSARSQADSIVEALCEDHGSLPRPPDASSRVRRRLAAVAARAVAVRPQERWPTAAAMESALHAARAADRGWSRPSWRVGLGLLVAAIAVAALVIGRFPVTHVTRPPAAPAPRTTPDLLTATESLASAYAATGAHEEALSLYRRALALREQRDGPTDEHTIAARARLGAALAATGQGQAAAGVYQQAHAALAERLGPHHPRVLAVADALRLLQASVSPGSVVQYVEPPRADTHPTGDPFVRPLGVAGNPALPLLQVAADPETKLYVIEATTAIRDEPASPPRIALQASTPLHVYVIAERRGGALELWRPQMTEAAPLLAQHRHQLVLPANALRWILVGSPSPLAEFEEALSTARVPTSVAAASGVPLTARAREALRALDAGPPQGTLLSFAREVSAHPELVRGLWIREVRPAERHPHVTAEASGHTER